MYLRIGIAYNHLLNNTSSLHKIHPQKTQAQLFLSLKTECGAILIHKFSSLIKTSSLKWRSFWQPKNGDENGLYRVEVNTACIKMIAMGI